MGRGPFLSHWWPSSGYVLTWPKWRELSECLLRYSAQCVEQGKRGSLNQYAIQLSCDSTYSETAPGFIGLGFRSAKLLSFLQLILPFKTIVESLWFWLTYHRLEVATTFHGLQMPLTSLDCCLYFWPTDCKSQVPTAPSLGSINLLEQIKELRETFCLLDH